ncbi:hypothetical protein [Massilia sp. LC238]|uniref:competence protein CoiA family protein n=1 Tax=Massilia sp. LC238 TaxID=1502852 RepID=UPI00126A3DFC|nr:hypothetical protein [Massilia sp. LC238]
MFVECGGRKIAIEVHISQQTIDEYERRSEKYLQSGVRVVWLINSRHFENFTMGCLKTNGVPMNMPSGPVTNGEQYHRKFPAFPLKFNCQKGNTTEAAVKAAVFLPPKGWPAKDLSLEDFAIGLARGASLHSGRKFWVWTL